MSQPSPSDLPPHFWDGVFGGQLIGSYLAFSLWGMSCIQTYIYFTNSAKDRLSHKYAVGLIMVLNTVSMAMLAHVPYYYLVTHYADPSAASRIIWTELIGYFLGDVSNLIIRILFARRVWLLSKGNIWMTGVIWLFAISAMGFAIADVTTLLGSADPGALMVEGGKYVPIRRMFIASFAIQMMAELTVTVPMCYCLYKSKTGFVKTDSLIKSLMKYIINTAALVIITTAVSVGLLFGLPTTTYTAIPYYMTSKVYVNSYLAMLNAREALRSDTINTTGMLPPLDTMSGSSRYDTSKHMVALSKEKSSSAGTIRNDSDGEKMSDNVLP